MTNTRHLVICITLTKTLYTIYHPNIASILKYCILSYLENYIFTFINKSDCSINIWR